MVRSLGSRLMAFNLSLTSVVEVCQKWLHKMSANKRNGGGLDGK